MIFLRKIIKKGLERSEGPLKMNNSGIEDCNIILYEKNKKLTKIQKWERTFASSAGELKSCIKDLISFSNFYKLLNKNSIEMFKKIYCFKEEQNKYIFSHDGGIAGASSELEIIFKKNFKLEEIFIRLETINW